MPILLSLRTGAFRTVLILAACLAAWSGPALSGQAVAAGTPSAVDGYNPNVNGEVDVLTLQSDGNLLVGGSFTQMQPEGSAKSFPCYNVARISPQGVPDPNFYPNVNGPVYAIAEDAQNRVIIGGSFSIINGTKRNNIARLNPDGTLDTTFNPDATGKYTSEVFAVAIQSDGLIVIGGAFNSLQPDTTKPAITRNHIARLNPDGSVDLSFDPNASAAVLALAIQPDGGIILAGGFNTLQPAETGTIYTRNHIARVSNSGAVDASFDPNADLSVSVVTLQPDGRILIGGNFTQVTPNGATTAVVTPDFARLNSDGTIDSSFKRPNPQDAVTAIALQPDGRILVGGRFTSLNPSQGTGSQAGNEIIRLNTDGSLDEPFILEVGINGSVDAIAVQSDGEVVLGGNFNQINAADSPARCNNLARFDSNGLPDVSFNPAVRDAVLAVAFQPSTGDMILGGSFTNLGGVTAQFLARITSAGVLDTSFNPQVNGIISRIVVDSSNRIIISGNFTTVQGTQRAGLARLNADGTLDTKFDPSPNVIGSVLAIYVQGNGQIVLGGNFTNLKPDGASAGTQREYIARVNDDGTLDTAFDPEANSAVTSIAPQKDGKLIIGGDFTGFQPGAATNTNANIVSIGYAARIDTDGSIDQSFSPEPNGAVNSVAVQSDGKILLAGTFTALGPNYGPSLSEYFVARVTSGGAIDTSFVTVVLNGSVANVALTPSGQIYVNGPFATTQITENSYFGTEVGNYFLRLNSNGSTDTSFGLALNGPIESFIQNSDGSLFVAGDFTAIGNTLVGDFVHLSAAGVFDSTFSVSSGSPAYSTTTSALAASEIDTLALEATGQVVVGGSFEVGSIENGDALGTIGGTTSTNIARFNLNGGPDLGFNPDADFAKGTGTGTPRVNAIATLSSSTPLSTQLSGVIWINSNGTPKDAFQVPAGFQLNGIVNTIVLDPTNTYIYVAGSFLTNANGSFGTNIVRFSYKTGLLDQSFNPNPIGGGGVRTVAIQADGKILLGGDFQSLEPPGTSAPVATPYIARLNPDGTLDTTFTTSLNGECAAITVEPSQQILIGGNFTTIGPNATSTNTVVDFYLAELNPDGTVYTKFNPDPNALVNTITVQSDGKILIGGNFTTVQPNGSNTSTFRGYIARLNADGSLDTAFDPEANSSVGSIVELSDDKILVGGSFTQFSPGQASATSAVPAVQRDYLARLNSDGTVDTAFNPNPNGTVNSIALASDGASIYVGGSFSAFLASAQAVPTPRNFIARLNPDGTLDPNFDPFLNSDVGRVVALPDDSTSGLNAVLASGDFTTSQPSGTMVVGGNFTTIGGLPNCNYLAELREDGTANNLFLPTPNGPVNALAVQTNNQIVLGGSFTSLQPGATGTPTLLNNVARINADGSLDNSFKPSVNGTVNAAALQGDGKILIGGSFTTVGGVGQGYLARLNADGTLDTGFTPNINGGVNAIAVQADGKIVIGGVFTSAGGGGGGYLARLNADGSVDGGFTPSVNNAVNAIVIVSSGGSSPSGSVLAPTYTLVQGGVTVVPGEPQILIGGAFTSVGGTPVNYLARLTSAGALDPTFNPGADNTVNALALQADGRLIVGGTFGILGGQSRFRLGRLSGTQGSVVSQTLGVSTDLTSILWTVSGGPEYSQVVFQVSTDENTWTNLGEAVRVSTSSDWLLTGLSLPPNQLFYVRTVAVGPSTGNGSAGIFLYTSEFAAISPVGVAAVLPSFAGSTTATAVVNAPFAYAIAATNSPSTFTASGLPTGLQIDAGSGLIYGTPTQSGTYVVALTETNAAGTLNSSLTLTVGPVSTAPPVSPASRLINVSTRAVVDTADPLIAGFVIGGTAPKSVLLRAAGPALVSLNEGLGVQDVLSNPVIKLFNGSGQLISQAGSWGGNPALAEIFTELGAFPFALDSEDAAISTTLAPGVYTVQVLDGAGTGGTALAEVDDSDSNPLSLPQHIVNLSGRGQVGPSDILIGGFWIIGSAPKQVLIRGAGPSLANLGVTAPIYAPVLQIFDSKGNLIAQNSAWGTPNTVNSNYPAASGSDIQSAAASCYAFPFTAGSNDTAVLITLPPGGYTAHITTALSIGQPGSSGTALFEVYEMP